MNGTRRNRQGWLRHARSKRASAVKIATELLDELVRRILRVVEARRIIVFGSSARGEAGQASDLDLLIVVPDGQHRRRTAQALYRALAAVGVPKDLVVVTEGDVRNYADEPSLVLYPALREGIEVYHAAD